MAPLERRKKDSAPPDRDESIVEKFKEEIDHLTLGYVHCFVFYILWHIFICVSL